MREILNIISLTARSKKGASQQALPQSLAIAGRSIPLVVKRSLRARRAILRVDSAAGEIRLTLPANSALASGQRLIDAHYDWLTEQAAKIPVPQPFVTGADLPYRGQLIRLCHQVDAPRTPSLVEGNTKLLVGGPEAGIARRIEQWLKARALALLEDETLYFASQVDRTVASVRVGDTKGRWGSCTGRGRIAYSWRLIFMPDSVRRSIVAHEVAHLVHLNHSPAFYALHHSLIGNDDLDSRQWLARHGPALHWLGREG